ncbi:unnamed protein product [Discosporangium mesarthrocarpum]
MSRRTWTPPLAWAARALNRVTTFVPPPPSATVGRVLVVQVHPYGKGPSFTGALGDAVCGSLRATGHEVRVRNLYSEGFEPALKDKELRHYLRAHKEGKLRDDVSSHVRDLKWCSGLVLLYPTWWYSVPAMLKGWIDRTMVPGVAFDIADGSEPPDPLTGMVSRLRNITKVGVVTTFGNGFWNVRYVGDPGRRIVARGLRPLFHPECTVLWKGLYDVEAAPRDKREAFLRDVAKAFETF